MSKEKIYTHNNPKEDRSYKKCQCQFCGIVAQCTPSFDFYGEVGAGLKCENCLKKDLADLGVTKVIKVYD